MKALAVLFQLLTLFAQAERVDVLHNEHIHIISPACDRIDQYSDACYIGAGQQLTDLRVEMPCSYPGTHLFFSVMRAGYMRNWRVWVDNPCAASRQWFPLVYGGST